MSPQEILQCNSETKTLRDLVTVVIECVIAIHEGRLVLPRPGPKTRKTCVRHTPGFTPGKRPAGRSVQYTALQIATFLNRTQNMGPRRPRKADRDIRAVLNFLALVEKQEIPWGTAKELVAVITKQNALDLTQLVHRNA